MKDKFQIGDLVRLAIPGSKVDRGRFGLVVSKVLGPYVEGEEDLMMYNVLFDNTITTWYDPSLKKVEKNKE
jgi:hypothetical protein